MRGNNLKKLRIENGLTQDALGKIIGVTGSTIRMIEKGERNGSRKVVEALAKYFNVSVDVIENRTDDMDEKERKVMEIMDKLIEANIITNPNDISDPESVGGKIFITAFKDLISEKLNKIKKE